MFLIQPTDSSFLASSRLTMNIIDPAIELPMFMMSFFLWYVVFLSESECVQVFFLFFIYICIVIGEPIIRRSVLDPINGFNHVTFLCLFQARTWISNAICRGLPYVQWYDLRSLVIVRFVDIGGIVDHHWFNLLFVMSQLSVGHLQYTFVSDRGFVARTRKWGPRSSSTLQSNVYEPTHALLRQWQINSQTIISKIDWYNDK